MCSSYFEDLPKDKPCVKTEDFKLTDCLACSGCITNDEIEKFRQDISFLEEKSNSYAFIISPQVKKSIYKLYNELEFDLFEDIFNYYIKQTFNTFRIVDCSSFAKKNDNLISSECPAVVLYVERAFPNLIPLLSTSRTYQQIAAEYLNKFKENEKALKIVSIMQCYDKKDEIFRDGTKIDHFIGAKDFYNHIKSSFDIFVKDNQLRTFPAEIYEKCHKYTINEVSGLENCMNILRKYKSGNIDYFTELRICKGGCINGLAQIPVEADKLIEFDVLLSSEPEVLDFSRRVFKAAKKKTFKVDW